MSAIHSGKGYANYITCAIPAACLQGNYGCYQILMLMCSCLSARTLYESVFRLQCCIGIFAALTNILDTNDTKSELWGLISCNMRAELCGWQIVWWISGSSGKRSLHLNSTRFWISIYHCLQTVEWNVMDIQGMLVLFSHFFNQTPIFNWCMVR
jgi:hypothetical protein